MKSVHREVCLNKRANEECMYKQSESISVKREKKESRVQGVSVGVRLMGPQVLEAAQGAGLRQPGHTVCSPAVFTLTHPELGKVHSEHLVPQSK